MPIPEPPEDLRDYAQSLTNGWWLGRAGALEALELTRPFAKALDAYEEDLVRRARQQGYSWAEIAGAQGTTKQAAHRRFRHLEPAKRPRQGVGQEPLSPRDS